MKQKVNGALIYVVQLSIVYTVYTFGNKTRKIYRKIVNIQTEVNKKKGAPTIPTINNSKSKGKNYYDDADDVDDELKGEKKSKWMV